MNISPELQSIINVLKYKINLPKSPVLQNKINEKRWYELIHDNELSAFIGSDALPYTSNLLLNDYIRSGYSAFSREIEANRILNLLPNPILLKGSALIKTLYTEPPHRQMSDIDLIFHSNDDAYRAIDILKEKGFIFSGTGQKQGHHHFPPLVNKINELIFEIHTNLSTPPLEDKLMNYILNKRTKKIRNNMEILDPVFLTIHHSIHATADIIDAPLLRNIFEVAWLVSKLHLFEKCELERILKEFDIVDRAEPALFLAHKLFGTSFLGEPKNKKIINLALQRLEWTRSDMLKFSKWDKLKIDYKISSSALTMAKKLITDKLEKETQNNIKSIKVGDYTLAHDIDTGCVHLLGEE